MASVVPVVAYSKLFQRKNLNIGNTDHNTTVLCAIDRNISYSGNPCDILLVGKLETEASSLVNTQTKLTLMFSV